MLKYPRLFDPIRLGNTMFRNRLFASPISGRGLDASFCPDRGYIAFYERKAIGGAASVCVGDCVVDSVNGQFGKEMICLDHPDTHRPLNLLSAAVRRQGAVASLELQHGGMYSYYSHRNGNAVYGPVSGVNAAGVEYLEMPEEMIARVIERYARAAAWARQCGFGMVTIHGGHGWLLSQFMSSRVNTRRDKWGGSLENRMRLPLAICDAVRRANGPGFPIEIRISGDEATPEGYDLDEGVAIAKLLDGHVDLIHVSAGHHERPDAFPVTHPGIFSADSCNARLAAAVKAQVKTPVATVGAHSDPELLEELVASGRADVIEMARALLADPDLPKKARAGKPEEIRPCLRCLACFSNLITNGEIYCAVNPEIGFESDYRHTPPPGAVKTVLVAGGGIAGMQAALTASKFGHRVILCEKSGRLGGALRCEENVPFKKKIRDYIAFQERALEESPAELRLGTPVTPELALALRADVIIAALGARPVRPPIPGIDGGNVLLAEEVYAEPALAGRRVAVLGGGLVGQELAIYLAMLGREVTIIEMQSALNCGGNILHQLALDVELKRYGITAALSARAVSVSGGGVLVEDAHGRRSVAADTVVCAAGQAPQYDEAASLRAAAPEFYQIGDCVAPKNIMLATAMADAAAAGIGR